MKIIEAKDDLKDTLLGKFKDLSSKDKKYIMQYDGEEIAEGKKKDGSDWSEDEVMDLLDRDDRVLFGALKHLYACQTENEKASASTREHNGKGFNAYDAEFLTSICKQLLERGTLSPKQKEVARKKLKKYRKQLTALANS
jgi:hypothetical protein